VLDLKVRGTDTRKISQARPVNVLAEAVNDSGRSQRRVRCGGRSDDLMIERRNVWRSDVEEYIEPALGEEC